MSLVEFLLARIAEDEEVAYADIEPPPGYKPRPDDHPLILSARRVLAACEAKRRIVEQLQHCLDGGVMDVSPEYDDGYIDALDFAAKLLALPYADHPDYQQEWRP